LGYGTQTLSRVLAIGNLQIKERVYKFDRKTL